MDARYAIHSGEIPTKMGRTLFTKEESKGMKQ
jgi:hypothetical protein